MRPEHGGQIGNPPHVRSEEIAARIKDIGRFLTRDRTARMCGISRETLLRHYREEWLWAQDNLVYDLKAMLVDQAMEGKSVNAAKSLLNMAGEFKHTVELAGPGGGPIRTLDVGLMARLVDGKSDEELAALEQALSLVLLAAGADGRPVDGPADAGLREGDPEAE